MPRQLTSKTTNTSTSVRLGANKSTREDKGGSSTTLNNGRTRSVSRQKGNSLKVGESKSLANVACRISFSVPILGRVPIDSDSPC